MIVRLKQLTLVFAVGLYANSMVSTSSLAEKIVFYDTGVDILSFVESQFLACSTLSRELLIYAEYWFSPRRPGSPTTGGIVRGRKLYLFYRKP